MEGIADQIAELVKRARKLCAGFHETARASNPVEREWVIGALKKVQAMLDQLELEIR